MERKVKADAKGPREGQIYLRAQSEEAEMQMGFVGAYWSLSLEGKACTTSGRMPQSRD